MMKWEYYYVYIDIQRYNLRTALNEYGEQGWELVSISPGLLDNEYVSGFAVFKRPID